jgi:hypothetical protein
MRKVLALLTLAVLAFSAMTAPAFAPPTGLRIGERPYGHVEQNLPRRLESGNQAKNATQFPEWKRYLDDLSPFRPPGYPDNGIWAGPHN